MPRGRRTIITPEMRTLVLKLRADGMMLRNIATKAKLSKSTVDRILRGGLFVSDKPTKHEMVALSENNPELADIQERIAELQERAKAIVKGSRKRGELLKFVQQHNMTRGDLAWVHAQLPPARITRKMREKMAQKTSQQKIAAAEKGGEELPRG